MRIGLIATTCSPVRPNHAGSVEQLVWLLSREMTALGHEVTVFGCSDAESECECAFVETLPGPHGANGSPDDWMLCEWKSLAAAVARSEDFDVLHSNVYLWGVPLAQLSACPMLHTQHTVPYDDDATMWRMHPKSYISALSRFQWSEFPDLQPAGIVPHGIAIDQFEFNAEPEDYVCYLGRFIEAKGPREAIELARQAGIPIVLAGPQNEYFDQAIAPLVDGKNVIYRGAVDAAGRTQLLSGARALLYPLLSPEPFGLVQVEAMMCGTPVVAPRIGAIPEIVEDGITGVTAKPGESLLPSLLSALCLSRQEIRRRAVERFSANAMARGYLELYKTMIADG